MNKKIHSEKVEIAPYFGAGVFARLALGQVCGIQPHRDTTDQSKRFSQAATALP